MYANTLLFTFSVKLTGEFFFFSLHPLNFYVQRAPSHISLQRENVKRFPAAPSSPGSSCIPCSKGCPMLPPCAWAPGCCSATHPEEKGDKPWHTKGHRIILVPPASRKNSQPLSLPDGMGQCPALQITQGSPCASPLCNACSV